MALLERLLRPPGGGPLRVVLPPSSGPALRREVEDACREYAAALGARLPALVVEVVEAGGRQAVRPSWERIEGRGGPLYRLVVPLREGQVAAAELRELLLEVLVDVGAIVRGDRARPGGDSGGHGEGHRPVPAPPAPAVEERRQAAPPRRDIRQVRRRWYARGSATDLELPAPVGREELPELAEALAQRGLELVEAVPFPLAGPAGRLDKVSELVLAEPELVTACLQAMTRGIEKGVAFVWVSVPEGMVERLWEVGQRLSTMRLAAGALCGDGRVYLRLPKGIERVEGYVQGGWLERVAARAITSALMQCQVLARPAVTRVVVRRADGEEMELDVLALTKRGAVVWAECGLNVDSLVHKAPRRRALRNACFLPGDVALVVCARVDDGEAMRVQRAYGWPVWRLEQGMDALAGVVAHGLGPSGNGRGEGVGRPVEERTVAGR